MQDTGDHDSITLCQIAGDWDTVRLGWESLNPRGWSRRLTLFYKIMNNLTHLYTKEPVPSFQVSSYPLCNQHIIGRMRARTEKFQASFYPNCISEWNKLDPEIRLVPSVAMFKKSFCQEFDPLQKLSLGFTIQ